MVNNGVIFKLLKKILQGRVTGEGEGLTYMCEKACREGWLGGVRVDTHL